MQKAMPSLRWPVATASAPAMRAPERLVYSIDSFIVGLAWVRFGVAPGPGEAEDQG